MQKNQVQSLNYSTHAIEDLLKKQVLLERSAPLSAKAFGGLAEMLRESVKFILPNCCNLVEPEDLKQAHLDLARLPFPCVSFEIPWNQEDDGITHIGGMLQEPATKRIALCWEPEAGDDVFPELNKILQHFPDGGYFVVPIYWGPKSDGWSCCFGGIFMPYHNEILPDSMNGARPASQMMYESLAEVGMWDNKKTKQCKAEPFHLFPELFRESVEANGSTDKVYAQIIVDSRDEVFASIQACSVINCANIGTVNLEPPEKINKKRVAKGKQPFFSYKVLQLSDESNNQHSGSGGSHAAPRMHLRRGHLRRLKDKLIWVRASMVNAKSKAGAIEKEYAL